MSTDQLTNYELLALARFCLYRMDMDTRWQLAAEQPLTYQKMCPGTESFIAQAVNVAMSRTKTTMTVEVTE